MELTPENSTIKLEINDKLIEAIIEEIKKPIEISDTTIEKLTGTISNEIERCQRLRDRLYNLKELSEILGVNYQTLRKEKLPYHLIGSLKRKMYNRSEVIDCLYRK